MDHVRMTGSPLWVHADVSIHGVRVRISSPTGEELAKALNVMREHITITPVAMRGPVGVPDWAVEDWASRLWGTRRPDDTSNEGEGNDSAPGPTWREKPPLL